MAGEVPVEATGLPVTVNGVPLPAVEPGVKVALMSTNRLEKDPPPGRVTSFPLAKLVAASVGYDALAMSKSGEGAVQRFLAVGQLPMDKPVYKRLFTGRFHSLIMNAVPASAVNRASFARPWKTEPRRPSKERCATTAVPAITASATTRAIATVAPSSLLARWLKQRL